MIWLHHQENFFFLKPLIECTKFGADFLKKFRNSYDAAILTAMCLTGYTHDAASLGGGGTLSVYRIGESGKPADILDFTQSTAVEVRVSSTELFSWMFVCNGLKDSINWNHGKISLFNPDGNFLGTKCSAKIDSPKSFCDIHDIISFYLILFPWYTCIIYKY